MFKLRNIFFLKSIGQQIKFFTTSTQMKPKQNMVPNTTPRKFKSFGINHSIEEVFEKLDYSTEKEIQKQREKYQIELNYGDVFDKDLLEAFKQNVEKIEKHREKNNQITLKKETEALLNLYYLEIKKCFVNQNLTTLLNFSSLFLEKAGKLSFDLSNKEIFHKITRLYLEIFFIFNHYHYEEKNVLIKLISDFVKFLFSQLEAEVYQEVHNKKIGIIFEDSMNLAFFRENIANHTTIDYFEEIGVLPKNFSKEFIPCLIEIKNKNYEIYRKNIEHFFNEFDVFLLQNKEKSAFFEQKAQLDENQLKNLVKECKNLQQINELLFFLHLNPNVGEKEYFKHHFSIEIYKNFPNYLQNSSIQTILFFLLLSSRREYSGPPPKLQHLLIFEKLMSKIKTLTQFLSIFCNILDSSFSQCDKLLIFLYEHSKNHKFTLEALEILQLMRITQTFQSISYELNIIHILFKSIDDIFQKKYEQFSLQQKFFAFCFTHNLDIPSKLKLNLDITASINECPIEMFPKILSHLCDYSYNLLNFDHLETIARKNLKFYPLTTKINILQSFMYHLQGSKTFFSYALKKITAELHIENPDKFKEVPLNVLCNFYQVIFTIKHFYSRKLTELFNQNLNDWYESFQQKYEDFDQPFYPITLAFSKAEHEVEILLKKMNISYEKEKKLLLHKVDFFIDKNICLEIHGRHHYVNKVLFRGKDKWKERNLTKVGGYKYKAISVDQWNMSSNVRKQKILEERLKEVGIIPIKTKKKLN